MRRLEHNAKQDTIESTWRGTEDARAQSATHAVDFQAVRVAALARLPELLARWLPDGRRCGREWVALNPTRADRTPGSFSVNIETGRWADFATGDRGGDPIALAAYLVGCSQLDAARRLADTLGVT
jgi:hypothetical protein